MSGMFQRRRRTSTRSLPLVAALAVVAMAPNASLGAAKPAELFHPRLYSSDSPLNQPVGDRPQIDPNSALMIQSLLASQQEGGFVITYKRWTISVFYADATTPRYDVALTARWAPMRQFRNVPIPDFAEPDPSGDGHMLVIDVTNGLEYDFWQTSKSDNRWSATWVNATSVWDRGIFAKGFSATGSGFALGAGLIWPDELAAGRIDHALVFSYDHPKAGGPVAPATESDGISRRADAIPEGARLQLDPSLDLDQLNLTSYERTIARALQQYGMFLTDIGGGIQLYAASHLSVQGNPYEGILPNQTYIDLNIPVRHLRVLKLGPQNPDADSDSEIVAPEPGPPIPGAGPPSAPQIVDARLRSWTELDVAFDVPVEKPSAETPGNYTISDGVTVQSAALIDTQTVRLTTSAHELNKTYEVSADGVQSALGATGPNGSASYTLQPQDTYIVDNLDPGFETVVGDWLTWPSGGWPSPTGDFRYRPPGRGKNTCRWSINLPRDGLWEVLVYYPQYPQNGTNVPYTVRHAGGSTTVRVDQTRHGDQWNSLGIFEFSAAPIVSVSDDADGYVIADAVRFAYVGPRPQEPPTIMSPTTADCPVGELFIYTITAVGTGPITFEATNLPGWLSFDGTDTLMGMPSALDVGVTSPVALTATNALGSDARTLRLTVTLPDMIVDNRDPGFSVVSGTWATYPRYGFSHANPTGGDFRYKAPGSGASRCEWTADLPAEGLWEVYAWWWGYSGCGSNVPFTVRHADGATVVRKSLRVDGRNWSQSLGVFHLAKGPASVALSDAADGYVFADAVRFRYVGPIAPQAPTIAGPLVAAAWVGQPFSYTVEATGTSPITFDATNLPPGLSFDGVATIGGMPQAAGVWNVELFAANALGADTQTLELTIGVADIIVDNRDPNTEIIGTWRSYPASAAWKQEFYYSRSTTSRFRWFPALPLAGYYEVHAWWPASTYFSWNVPYRIFHAEGMDTANVSQRANGSRWNPLGTYPFQAGSTGYVVILGKNGMAAADAVKFVYVGPLGGTAQTSAASTSASLLDILVTPDEGKAPLEVQALAIGLAAGAEAGWDFGDGTVAAGEAVTHTYLSPGTYTIWLTVGESARKATVTVSGPAP